MKKAMLGDQRQVHNVTESWASNEATRRSMRANRSRDTAPEIALRRALFGMGLRYRVCTQPIPEIRSKVDIVFRAARIAVEVRGCFWHGCPEHHRLPSRNREYWSAKVARNISRDHATSAALATAGWALVEVWEHEDMNLAAERIARAVRERRGT